MTEGWCSVHSPRTPCSQKEQKHLDDSIYERHELHLKNWWLPGITKRVVSTFILNLNGALAMCWSNVGDRASDRYGCTDDPSDCHDVRTV